MTKCEWANVSSGTRVIMDKGPLNGLLFSFGWPGNQRPEKTTSCSSSCRPTEHSVIVRGAVDVVQQMWHRLERMVQSLVGFDAPLLVQHQHVLQQVHQLLAINLLSHQVHAVDVRRNINLQRRTTMSGAFQRIIKQELIRRWDSERELFLRPHRTTLRNIIRCWIFNTTQDVAPRVGVASWH